MTDPIAEFGRLRAERHEAVRDSTSSSAAAPMWSSGTRQRQRPRPADQRPGRSTLEAHVAEVARTRPLALSPTTAVDETARELTAAVEAEQPHIVAQAEQEGGRGSRGRRRAGRWPRSDRRATEVVAARAQRNWAKAFPERSKGASTRGVEVEARNGEPLSVDAVIGRLRVVVV